MSADKKIIATQQLHEVRKQAGPEFSLALDLLTLNLAHEYGADAREKAELLEARRMLLRVKHPDAETPVVREEMEWALSRTLKASETLALAPVSAAMRNVGAMLGIDAATPRGIPQELDKKIANAVKVLRPEPATAAA